MKIKESLRTLPALLGLIAFMAVTQPQARAQETNSSDNPNHGRFEIDIQDGSLLMASIKDRVNIKQLWGPGTVASVPATIENIGKYLSAADTNLNLVVSPDAAEVTIQNLKLRAADIAELMQALTYATQGAVRGNQISGGTPHPGPSRFWAISGRPTPPTEQTVEVFNLSGFIDHLNQAANKNSKSLDEELTEIKKIILDTVIHLKQGHLQDKDTPSFSFHPGTGLFIVIGTPTAAEVARKIVNALPGQPQPGSAQMVDLHIPKKEN
jgi:hypothetical protein